MSGRRSGSLRADTVGPMARDTDATGVLFVCLGNICRSPLAEGIFIHRAKERGMLERLRVDSCGTGHWHAGSRADPRSLDVARAHGIELPSIARQYDPRTDLEFDWIVAMDRQNKADLLRAGAPRARVRLMRSFDPALADEPASRLDVPDPYYGARGGFQEVFDMLSRACDGLLHELVE